MPEDKHCCKVTEDNMYDFDKLNDRRNTCSLKWDVAENELPMWVADMDFMTAPEITAAIEKRAAQGIFGYTVIPDEWYDAYIGWWKSRHGLDISREELIFCTGVVPAISSMVRKLTTPAEKVLVMTPVYNIFFNSVLNNGRQVIKSQLKYDGAEYQIDFDDLEKKLSDPQTALMILCNPQNPSGRIWSRDELERIGGLCARYHVTVISDEIHCDLTDPGYSYTPFASVSDICRQNSITCIAPTKAFNIAGIQTAAVMVSDPFLRHRVWRGLNTDEAAEPNVFAVTAAVAAFTQGGMWLDELREYIARSKELVYSYVRENIPQIKVMVSHATYLLWLDISGICDNSEEAAEFIRKETGLYLSDGKEYGGDGSFLRMNIACPRQVLADGLERLKVGIEKYIGR